MSSRRCAAPPRARPRDACAARRGGPAGRGRAATAGERPRRAARRGARARRLPPPLEPVDALERRVVRGAPALDRPAGAVLARPIRPSRSARCGRAASCWSCAPTSCASRPPRRTSSSTAASGWSSTQPTCSCSWRAPRAGPRASISRRSRCRAAPTSTAGHGLRRHERACRRLPRRRGARGPRARPAGVHAAHLGAGAPLRSAVRCGPRALRRERRARVAGAVEPVPARAGRSPAVVSLPSPLRPDPPGRAGATRARDRVRSASARVRVAQPVRHDRRGHPPCRRRARLRGGRGADRRDLGSLRERRPHDVRAGLAGPLPGRDPRRRSAIARGQGVGGGAARARGRDARRDGPRPRARRPGDGAAARRVRVARVEPVRPERDVRMGRRVGDRRARAALRAARRGRLAVAAGHHLGTRLGSLLQRRSGRGRALAHRDDSPRPARRPMDRRRRRDRRPLAHRGPPRPSRRPDATRRRGCRALGGLDRALRGEGLHRARPRLSRLRGRGRGAQRRPDARSSSVTRAGDHRALRSRCSAGSTRRPSSWATPRAARSPRSCSTTASARPASPSTRRRPKGVKVVPLSQIKSTFPVLKNPANHHRAVGFTFEQWHYAFTNTFTDEERSRALRALPHPGVGPHPLGQRARQHRTRHQDTWVNYHNDDRAPLLFISGADDHLMPPKIQQSNLKHYKSTRSPRSRSSRAPTCCPSSDGWEEVADYALEWALARPEPPRPRR